MKRPLPRIRGAGRAELVFLFAIMALRPDLRFHRSQMGAAEAVHIGPRARGCCYGTTGASLIVRAAGVRLANAFSALAQWVATSRQN
jgi:hypothetical protein